MAWARLDDGFPEHPKVLAVGPFGLTVFVRALCYSARNLTDGFIPNAATASFTVDFARTSRAAHAVDWPARLVAAGLWDMAPGGYLIHDYLAYNPSKEKVLAERKAAAERVKRWRADPRNAKSNTVTLDACNGVTNGGVTVEVTPPPSPSPPLPLVREKKDHRERGRFTPPTLAEVQEYLVEIGAAFTAERFIDHHEETGWRWGKPPGRPVKDWRRTARTWKARDEERGASIVRPRQPVDSRPADGNGKIPKPSTILMPPDSQDWKEIRETLRAKIDERDFTTFIDRLRPTAVTPDDGALVLVTDSREAGRDWLIAEFGEVLRPAVRAHGYSGLRVLTLEEDAGK